MCPARWLGELSESYEFVRCQFMRSLVIHSGFHASFCASASSTGVAIPAVAVFWTDMWIVIHSGDTVESYLILGYHQGDSLSYGYVLD